MQFIVNQVLPMMLFPLAAFIINIAIIKRFTKVGVALSTLSIGLSAGLAIKLFIEKVIKISNPNFLIEERFEWFNLNGIDNSFSVNMGFFLDNMSITMLLMVTCVAFLIHLFSTYYMKDDVRFGRFFVYLSLFTMSMIGLVLSNNLLSVFIFWELMGFCSYSLIGFYYEDESCGNASIKAFMTTRIGDVFFLLAIVMIWTVVGSVNYTDIYSAISSGAFLGHQVLGVPILGFISFSVFMGTIGKSAQFPLQVWLPDAMKGPTPCSALIHAATMVAAGVYLSLRMIPIYEAANFQVVITYIGAITAFGAATIAVVQTDLKAVLAYSTISQLGYMVLGIGVGAYNASFMHLITHAVFKACLFLSAGSVIHSLHDHKTHGHVQEMTRMGGLKSKLPITWIVMWMCTLAIAGVPLFSGFVSKDRILAQTIGLSLVNKTYLIPTILGFAGAMLTTFYMFRMMIKTFHGEARDKELYGHIKKEKFSLNRNLPLLLLSIFTLGFWFSGSLLGQEKIALFGGGHEWFQNLIQKPNLINLVDHEFDHHLAHVMALTLSLIVVSIGALMAYLFYGKNVMDSASIKKGLSGYYKTLQNKYYFDNFYIQVLIKRGLLPINEKLAGFDMGILDRYLIDGQEFVVRVFYKISNFIDRYFVDGMMVDGTGASVRFFNVVLRVVQNGKIQFYIVIAIISMAGFIINLKGL